MIPLRVLRAHSYLPVERATDYLSRVPQCWLRAVGHVGLVLLPDDLSPLYVGLMLSECATHDGRKYSECGGWFYEGARQTTNEWARRDPYIYLTHTTVDSILHEVGHGLAAAWRAPQPEFFHPATAFYPYMAANASEYFACAVDAFLWPERDDVHWNRLDLWLADPELFAFLTARSRS